MIQLADPVVQHRRNRHLFKDIGKVGRDRERAPQPDHMHGFGARQHSNGLG